MVDATYGGMWELPVVGEVAAPSVLLIRPDGHVAWRGGATDEGLSDALRTWFGVGVAPSRLRRWVPQTIVAGATASPAAMTPA